MKLSDNSYFESNKFLNIVYWEIKWKIRQQLYKEFIESDFAYLTYHEVLKCITHQKCKEALIENFGSVNAKYHTLDEIPLYKLIEKVTYDGMDEIQDCEQRKGDTNV
jgi:hypothetical protein